MIRKYTTLFGLVALFIAHSLSYAQTTANHVDGDPDATTSLSQEGDRRLSNRELRERVFSLERGLESYRTRVDQLELSLTASQGELQRLKTNHLKFSDDMAKTLSSVREARIGSDEILRDQTNELAKKLSSENAERIAASEANASKISLVNERVSYGEQELTAIARSIRESSDALGELNSRVTVSEAGLAEQEKLLNSKFIDISDAVSSQTLVGAFAVILFSLVIFFLARRMVASRRLLVGQISDSNETLRNEYGDLDLKISALLEKQLSRLPAESENQSGDDQPDHSLPLQVAAEIHRMSKRLDNMPEGTKGVQPLSKALERLVDGLAENGYEMVPLVGTKYVEGMTIKASFTVDDELSPSDQIISRVIKPQVNYNGTIVQVADVEVSVGE